MNTANYTEIIQIKTHLSFYQKYTEIDSELPRKSNFITARPASGDEDQIFKTKTEHFTMKNKTALFGLWSLLGPRMWY